MPAIFSATDISKRYGPVQVLDRVALSLNAGEIHALLGANGAGKSTLCKIIAGLTPCDSGQMQLADAPYRPHHKQAAEAAGVQIVQQELNQVATLTVAENILLTRMPSRLGVVDRGELNRRARVALDRLGLHEINPQAVMGTLGVGHQQMVEIATALDRQCRLLILDEPTAALSGGETERLFSRLNELRDQGVAILYISHRLDEISRLADRITVLRDGRWICTQDAASMSTDDMIQRMSGEQSLANAEFQSSVSKTSQQALRVEQLSGGMVHDVSFTLARGERLGVAGLVGSGRTELLRLIFGADPPTSGRVIVGDAQQAAANSRSRFTHPRQATAAGLAMITEDRKQNGLLLPQSIRFNTTLNSLVQRFAVRGLLKLRKERSVVDEMIETLEIRCRDSEQPVATLSGGNQQKVAVAKWLVRDAEVFFFDEPTRGIDVSARRRIYRLMDALAAAGKGIVIVSSDLEELIETCDRIGVMSAGRWVAEYQRNHWDREQIMRSAFSGYQDRLPSYQEKEVVA